MNGQSKSIRAPAVDLLRFASAFVTHNRPRLRNRRKTEALWRVILDLLEIIGVSTEFEPVLPPPDRPHARREPVRSGGACPAIGRRADRPVLHPNLEAAHIHA